MEAVPPFLKGGCPADAGQEDLEAEKSPPIYFPISPLFKREANPAIAGIPHAVQRFNKVCEDFQVKIDFLKVAKAAANAAADKKAEDIKILNIKSIFWPLLLTLGFINAQTLTVTNGVNDHADSYEDPDGEIVMMQLELSASGGDIEVTDITVSPAVSGVKRGDIVDMEVRIYEDKNNNGFLDSGTDEDLRSVFFIDEASGWVVGDNGTVLRTTDGGMNWTPLGSGTGEDLFGLCFADESTGWVGGREGVLLDTTDGGESWIPLAPGTSEQIRSITFLDPELGWVDPESGRANRQPL